MAAMVSLRRRFPAKSAPLQRGRFLRGGVALLSLRPGHWKGRCCAEGDPRKDRQVQKDLVKGGGKSGKMAGGPFEINGTCNIKLGLYI